MENSHPLPGGAADNRPAQVSDEQLKALLNKLRDNADRYLFDPPGGEDESEKGQGRKRSKEKRVQGARFALESLAKRILADAERGIINPDLGTFEKFCSQALYARKNDWRAEHGRSGGITRVPKTLKEQGKFTLVSNLLPDSEGRESRHNAEDLAALREEPSPDVVDSWWLRHLTTALLPQILNVLGEREKHGYLTPEQVESVWVLFAVEVDDMPVPQEIAELVDTFQPSLCSWRADLARAREARKAGLPLPDGKAPGYDAYPVQQNSITHGIARARGLITICLYLFITLAPPTSVVYRAAEMHRLLDLVFEKGKTLTTRQRTLLRKAGRCLRWADKAFRVDLTQLHAEVQLLKGFRGITEQQVADELHDSEERYARQVPGQNPNHPRFDCVLSCAAHTLESTMP